MERNEPFKYVRPAVCALRQANVLFSNDPRLYPLSHAGTVSNAQHGPLSLSLSLLSFSMSA